MSKGRMIFHAPYVVDECGVSASRVRPYTMREAFRAAGWEVCDLSGTLQMRRQAFRELRRRIRAGERFDFCYSESSTQPNSLATSIRTGFDPFLDARIFCFLRAQSVPCGVFYRDVHWRFPSLRSDASLLWRLAIQILHRLDLLIYRLCSVRLFLPSVDMAHFLPSWAVRSVCALPPGIDHFGDCAPPERGTLRLAYVGAVGANYRIHGLLEALADLRGVALDMSIPAPVWKSHSAEYSHFLGPSIRLHHLRHDEIGSLYSAAHVGTLIVEASEYWTFAVPAKLFEYIGCGMAVIASSGTLAARLVEDLGVGWVVDPTVASIRALLEYLRDTPEDIETCRRASRAIRADHTWESRVRTVVQELTAWVRQSDDPGARS